MIERGWGVIGTFSGVFVASGAVLVSVTTVVGGLVFGEVTRDRSSCRPPCRSLTISSCPPSPSLTNPTSEPKNDIILGDMRLATDNAIQASKDRSAENRKLIDGIAANQVPRSEHVSHWADFQRQIDDLRDRAEKLEDAHSK